METQTVIVAADDFTAPGLAAVHAGLDLARRLSGDLHLLHVLSARDLEAAPGTTQIEKQDHLLQTVPSRIWARIVQAGATIPGLHELRVTVHVRLGDPAVEIDRTAADVRAHMIVAGTASKRGIERLVLGSVAETLVREAHCPVLVVRERDFRAVQPSERPEPAIPGEDLHKPRPEHPHVYRSSQLFSFGNAETHGPGTGR